jgi:hypothetical protein
MVFYGFLNGIFWIGINHRPVLNRFVHEPLSIAQLDMPIRSTAPMMDAG